MQPSTLRLPDVDSYAADPFGSLRQAFLRPRVSGGLFSGCRDVTLPAASSDSLPGRGPPLPDFLRPGSPLQCKAWQMVGTWMAASVEGRQPQGQHAASMLSLLSARRVCEGMID